MIGSTHIRPRFLRALVLAAAAAALSTPAALAGLDQTGHDFPGASVKPFLTVEPRPTYSLPQGFQTDSVSSARAALGLYRLDPAWAAAIDAQRNPATSGGDRVPRGSATGAAPRIEVVGSRGFDWSSFGVGLGAGVAGVVGLGLVGARTGRLGRLAGV